MGRAGGITLIATACLGLLAAQPHAHAQPDRAQVSTHIDDCVPIDRERFHRLLKIQLGPSIEYVSKANAGGAPGSLTSISLTCVAAGIELHLEDRLTRKSMRRTIALDHVAPQSRSRLMALTAAEFVFASWLEVRLPEPMVREVLEPPERPPPIAVKDSATRALDEKVPSSASSGPSWQLAVALELMAFSSASELIPCVALRVSHALSSAVGLRLAVQVGRANLSGEIEGRTTSVELTTTSLLAGLTYDGVVGDFELYAGGGARFGFAYARGAEPAMSQSGEARFHPVGSYAPWAGGAILMGAGLRAGAHARIVLGLEAGWVAVRTLAVTDTQAADTPPVVALTDAWGLATLGAGWAF